VYLVIAAAVLVPAGLVAMKADQTRFVVFASFLALTCGLLIAHIAHSARASSGFRMADRVVNAVTENGDGVAVDLTSQMSLMVLFGVLLAGASTFGCSGAALKSRPLVAFYTLASAAFSVFFMFSGLVFVNMIEELEPQIHAKTHDLCSSETYPLLFKHAHCAKSSIDKSTGITAGVDTSVSTACGPACSKKLSLLHEMGGCETLSYLCSAQSFENIGYGNCALSNGKYPTNSFAKAGSETLHKCRQTCEADLKCVGIEFVPKVGGTDLTDLGELGQCAVLGSSVKPLAAFGTDWAKVAHRAGGSYAQVSAHGSGGLQKTDARYAPATVCFAKASSRAVQRFIAYVTSVGVAICTLGVVLFVSAILNCILLLSISKRRRRDKLEEFETMLPKADAERPLVDGEDISLETEMEENLMGDRYAVNY